MLVSARPTASAERRLRPGARLVGESATGAYPCRGGGLLASLHFEVPDELRHAEAQECERRSLVDLLGIVSKPDVRPEVAVHHGRTAVEFDRLNSHICQRDPLFPPARFRTA